MILLAFIPLAYPAIPPLVDIGGHMGRYKVAVDLAGSPILQQWFSFRWLPIGNLGVDLLVVPLAKLIGVELATKLIVMSIPPLTVAGMLWVAREVHNRLPPTVAFALPLAFGHPFMFGFLAVSWRWLCWRSVLARLGRWASRAARDLVRADGPSSFAHTYGWGSLGVDAFGRGGSPARLGLFGGRRSSGVRCMHPSWRCRYR
jgi:hypothetical protein